MVSPDSSITSEERAACRAALRDLFGRDVRAVGTEDSEVELGCEEETGLSPFEGSSGELESLVNDLEGERAVSMWAGIAAGEAIGAAKDVGLAYLNDMFSARQMARGYKYAKKMMKKGPSYQVAGLRRAGLNPILAAGGMQMGGSSAIPTHSARSVSGSRFTGVLDYMTAKNIQAQTRKTLAEARVSEAEADAVKQFGLGATRPTGKWIDTLIEIFDPQSGQWSAKGGTPASRLKALKQRAKQNVDYWRGKRGKTYRYRLPPDTGRSGYEQHLTRIR